MILEILTEESIPCILPIVSEVNSNIKKSILAERLNKMFSYKNYICFGLYESNKLIAISGGWKLTKLYSGNQIELDNVAVIRERRSKGIGKILIDKIEKWAKEHSYNSIELNSYVSNERSHKFYFSQDYKILGYHFQKTFD